jgi:transcriptional repressor NrdR
MYCPKCGALEDKVIDSRLSKDGKAIRRRRECLGCEHRFTTYEEIERNDLRVAKRDGRSEPLNRQKLYTGMLKACDKRPVSPEQLEKLTDEIILEIENEFPREVPYHVIGAKVMARLHQLDPVAFVRYASVYRSFEDVGEFIEDMQQLERRQQRSAGQPELFK